ncbi:hypothetical protein FLJC2902T_13020 [Flavobacterium limnosediminis JC2902]|uniref:Uncharacterized protein n=1 Tax=Flavobacterium limnosediminis JC2902 TaxID=1341181 RepID=V6SQ23_9FLAO|nr:hypothetical protein [Flavobacterium limnosediminis]ESU28711.1 hypothetical protein FLJC2902T_13020 [Flavobacterium limnosediminis JC2902]
MIRTVIIIILYFINLSTSYSQNIYGYWDKERATTREIVLGAGDRTWVRTDDLPIGTTEVVYRITLLDEDQKMVNDLASVLTILPDPTRVSKGSAVAISLMSKAAGDDKCYYSIFKTYEAADNYSKTGNYQTACYSNPNEINREVNRITLNNSACLKEDTGYIWFGFKNTNMIMSEKIVLEVMPWVDYKASRGWTKDIKNKFIQNCKTNSKKIQISNSEQYCLCLLNKLEEKYKLQEYQKLIPEEQNKILQDINIQCLNTTGELDKIYNEQRNTANTYIQRHQYSLAINKYLDIISNTTPKLEDYNNLAYSYILTKQFLKAIKYLKEGEKLDETDLLIKGNLAHAYLLNGDVELAKSMYIKYKSQNISENLSWIDMVKTDFEDFKRAGIHSDQFETIKVNLN